MFLFCFRQYALEKVKAMAEFVGYPDEILVIENLEDFYEKVYVLFNNFLTLQCLSLKKIFKNVGLRFLKPNTKCDSILHNNSISGTDACQ